MLDNLPLPLNTRFSVSSVDFLHLHLKSLGKSSSQQFKLIGVISFLRLLKLDSLYIMYSCLPTSCCNKYNTFELFCKNLSGQPLTRPWGSTGCSSHDVFKVKNDLHLWNVTSCQGYLYENHCLWQLLRLSFLHYLPLFYWFLGKAKPQRNLELFLSPWSKQVVMVTDTAWLYLFFCSPRALALIHLVSQREGRKKDFHSTERHPEMQSLRDDVCLKSWVAVKSPFQRSGASEERGCWASVNEIRCLSETQELLKERTKQRLSILGSVHHQLWKFATLRSHGWDLPSEVYQWPRASGQGWLPYFLLQSREGLFGGHFHTDLSHPVLYMSPKMQRGISHLPRCFASCTSMCEKRIIYLNLWWLTGLSNLMNYLCDIWNHDCENKLADWKLETDTAH